MHIQKAILEERTIIFLKGHSDLLLKSIKSIISSMTAGREQQQ